jgi:hypothetical protein
MNARRRSREIQLAKSQKVQEVVHQVLYCDTDWNEYEIYGRRFQKIVGRSEIDETSINVDDDVVSEFKRRVERKLKGIEPLDKSLLFYRILDLIGSRAINRESILSELEDFSEHCVDNNMIFLEECGCIEQDGKSFRLSPSTKKLLK